MQGPPTTPKAPLGNNSRPLQDLHYRTIRTNIDFRKVNWLSLCSPTLTPVGYFSSVEMKGDREILFTIGLLAFECWKLNREGMCWFFLFFFLSSRYMYIYVCIVCERKKNCLKRILVVEAKIVKIVGFFLMIDIYLALRLIMRILYLQVWT